VKNVRYSSSPSHDILTYCQVPHGIVHRSSAGNGTLVLFCRDTEPSWDRCVFGSHSRYLLLWVDVGIRVLTGHCCFTFAGQFERGEEPPYEGGFADIVEGVCSGLADLGCLNDENGIPLSLPDQKRNDVQQHAHEFTRKSPVIPLVMLGFSLGTCFTIGLVQHLQRSRGIEVSQVVSMGGLTHSKMKVQRADDYSKCLITHQRYFFMLLLLLPVSQVSHSGIHPRPPQRNTFGIFRARTRWVASVSRDCRR
jgi:hypothetical protein